MVTAVVLIEECICRKEELRAARPIQRPPPPLRRGRVSPTLPVPDHIQKPPYVDTNEIPELSSEYQIHDAQGIARMREACQLAARVLEYAGTLVTVRKYYPLIMQFTATYSMMKLFILCVLMFVSFVTGFERERENERENGKNHILLFML